jgi:hypothetical protein
MNGWIGRLKVEAEQGQSPPEAGPLGYGDPTSCFLMSEAVTWTSAIGAVRHGAECFNYHFPQNLDEDYLVTWDGFVGGTKFKYNGPPNARARSRACARSALASPCRLHDLGGRSVSAGT